MALFTMLIGPAGCGKTRYAYLLKNRTPAKTVVLSSDELRAELLGDEKDQSNNALVFNEMTRRARQCLSDDVNVVFDATNMARKRRIGILQSLPADAVKHAVVICARLDEILRQDAERPRSVGEDVIMRQLERFQPPCAAEGFDHMSAYINDSFYKMEELLDMMRACGHDNEHHSPGSVMDHCNAVAHAAIMAGDHPFVTNACLWHDVGKPFVKTVGEDGQAHYIGHAGTGAYVFLAAGGSLKIAAVIAEHMHMHQKTFRIDRLRRQAGDEIADACLKLRKYDEENP